MRPKITVLGGNLPKCMGWGYSKRTSVNVYFFKQVLIFKEGKIILDRAIPVWSSPPPRMFWAPSLRFRGRVIPSKSIVILSLNMCMRVENVVNLGLGVERKIEQFIRIKDAIMNLKGYPSQIVKFYQG